MSHRCLLNSAHVLAGGGSLKDRVGRVRVDLAMTMAPPQLFPVKLRGMAEELHDLVLRDVGSPVDSFSLRERRRVVWLVVELLARSRPEDFRPS